MFFSLIYLYACVLVQTCAALLLSTWLSVLRWSITNSMAAHVHAKCLLAVWLDMQLDTVVCVLLSPSGFMHESTRRSHGLLLSPFVPAVWCLTCCRCFSITLGFNGWRLA